MSSLPLLSVVIPTYKRPQLLPHAIESALKFATIGDVEVIVVPNGKDDSWKIVAESFKSEKNVRWHPIDKAHANAARNAGKCIAKGKYLWFLDDDDYLLEGAIKQISQAENNSLEICSASVNLVDQNGRLIKRLDPAPSDDFVSALLSPERRTGFQFHLYLRASIDGFWLDERINVGQDTHWVHTLCQLRDWRWGKVDVSGCTWRHHTGSQISATRGAAGHLKLQEIFLWETIVCLADEGRLFEGRAKEAARGMWSLVHAGFFLNPSYWGKVMKKLQNYFPETYPDVLIYNYRVGKIVPPLAMESIMLPKRWLNHARRQRLVKLGVKNAWEF